MNLIANLFGVNYIGRTERRLSIRAAEHIPKWILKVGMRPRSAAEPNSAISRHVLKCNFFDKSRAPFSYFSILYCSRNARLLKILEALTIKRLFPSLCVQKDTFELRLSW